MNFNEKEYIKLLTYILSKCYDKPHVGKTVLKNMLYYIDFNYYEFSGEFLTKETYIKTERGPESKHFKKITEKLISKNQLYLRKEPYYHTTLHKYYLTRIPDVKFPKNKLFIIDSSIQKLINKNATKFIRYTRKDPPYQIAKINEEISYENVILRDEKYSFRKKFINL